MAKSEFGNTQDSKEDELSMLNVRYTRDEHEEMFFPALLPCPIARGEQCRIEHNAPRPFAVPVRPYSGRMARRGRGRTAAAWAAPAAPQCVMMMRLMAAVI